MLNQGTGTNIEKNVVQRKNSNVSNNSAQTNNNENAIKPYIEHVQNNENEDKNNDIKNYIKHVQVKENGKFKNAGTGNDSWFTLDKARKLVNYEKGEMIVESDGVNILWEVL
jgi:hypothetical protein